MRVAPRRIRSIFTRVKRVHDIGGDRDRFGPIERGDVDEPPFRARWEGRVLGTVMAFAGIWRNNVDELRDLMEELDQSVYFGGPYWGRWLSAFEQMLDRHGFRERTAPRLRAWYSQRALPLVFGSGPMPRWLARLYPRRYGHARATSAPPRFVVGDVVQVRGVAAAGHTRCPGYVRNKRGRVVRHAGAMDFPDARARDVRAPPQHVYSVAFDARDVWSDGEERVLLHVDLFESYLEPA